jgi:cytochrome c-type biogenesis protein
MGIESALTSIGLGLLASASPCVLPLYPGFLAFLAADREHGPLGRGRYLLGAFVLAGVLSMMLLFGLAFAALSISVGQALSILVPLADVVIVGFGILLLLDRNPFQRLPQVQVPVLSHPFANAYIYGLLYGPIALPCSGPLVVGIFAFSLTVEEAVSKLAVFLWFGFGFGLPLLALSLISGAAQTRLTRVFARRGRVIHEIGGLLLVGVGVLDFVQNWEFVRPYFG